MPQQDYARKARTLRRIMSAKSAKYDRYNTIINVLTVVVAGFVTFAGFYGTVKIRKVITDSFGTALSEDTFDFWFAFFTFSLLVLIFLQLFFRFSDRKSQADAAIVELSSFINFVADRQADIEDGKQASAESLEVIREKYRSIISSIPSNTDEEYKAARKPERAQLDSRTPLNLDLLGSRFKELAALRSIIEMRSDLKGILSSLESYREGLWVGGGIFRNAVWDTIHGYDAWTAVEDVDVVYYDAEHLDKAFDTKLESELTARFPSQNWSVKNQARMHLHNSESQYSSLEDAISKWPETCTAFCVKLESSGDINVISPHGLTDLFSLIIRPTPSFVGRKDRIASRIAEKHWLHKWPRLRDFCK